ncbi:MAG: hypothetical protein WC953_10375 [Pseudomonas sp.]
MTTYFKYVAFLLLLGLTAQVQADAQQAQNLHELRSEGYRAATFLLIDNNLYERIREPGNREAYNEALGNMERFLRQMENPSDLRTPYNQFVRLIRELETQTEDEAHYHLATVNQIMMTHAEFDKAVAARYAALAGEIDEALLALHQQSLETNQILLLYQNNMFSSIGVYFMETSEGIFRSIDASIVARADALKRLLPEKSAALQNLDKQYGFIQPRLLDHHTDWVPTIAAFYLIRNTQTLNQMARDQLQRG